MYVWTLIALIGVTLASIDPLPDGLLLTKASHLRVQTAEWTVLVVIDNPSLDPKLLPNIEIMVDSIQQAGRRGLINSFQCRSWTGRLQFLRTYLTVSSPDTSSVSPKRSKRGWFNFMGAIGHTLFGLATDDSIERCRQAIAATRKYQRAIVHCVNQLTTVLNRTQAAVAWNRHQITKVAAVISNLLVPKLNHVITSLNNTNRRLYLLERVVWFERVIGTLEHVTQSHLHLLRTHARQKASLEMGRLTEDILPIFQLRDILTRATTTTTYPITPIQWYYEHAHVYPVWGRDNLVYRVKLPLIDGRQYNRYHIATWPVPYATKGYSIQIQVPHNDVGMSTTNADIFHPTGCIGWKPIACRTGPLFSARQWTCPRILISGDIQRREHCRVILEKHDNLTQVTEISHGEYVVVTWGETFETRCQGRPSVRKTLAAGTYLVAVMPDCVVMGTGVTLTGFIERMGHVSVKALRIPIINTLNLTDIVPQERALSLLKTPTFRGGIPLVQLDLAPLPTIPTTFDWSYHGSRMSFGLLITLVVVLFCLLLTVVILWHKKALVASRCHRWLSKTEYAWTVVTSSPPEPVTSDAIKPSTAPSTTTPPPLHPLDPLYPILTSPLPTPL